MFLLKRKELFSKKLILFLIITPIILASIFNYLSFKNTNDPRYGLLNSETHFLTKSASIISKTIIRNDNNYNFSSNRFDIWKKTLEISKKNIIIGYGFQADRKLINQSVHNVYLYALISGGILGLVLIIFISIRSAWTSFFLLFNYSILKKKLEPIDLISSFLMLSFLLRGLLETSSGIYSIDYL
jgi:hypothetical protein